MRDGLCGPKLFYWEPMNTLVHFIGIGNVGTLSKTRRSVKISHAQQ